MERTGLKLCRDLEGSLMQLFGEIERINAQLAIDRPLDGKQYMSRRIAACLDNLRIVSQLPESRQLQDAISLLHSEPVKHGRFRGDSYLDIAIKYAADWRGYWNLNCDRHHPDDEQPFDEATIMRAGDLRPSIMAVQMGIDNEWLWLAVRKEIQRSSQNAQSAIPPSSSLPSWNRETGELTVGGRLCKRLQNMNLAVNVGKILDAFEECGWPRRIDDPLPGTKSESQRQSRRRESIKSLNDGLRLIHFSADGTTEGIRWEYSPSPSRPPAVT